MRGALLLAGLFTACGMPVTATPTFTPAADAQAERMCQMSGYAQGRTLAAAFATTAADVVRWQETPHGPDGPRRVSSYRSLAPTEVMYLCYFDGMIAKGPPRPLHGTPPPPFDRIAVYVAPGLDALDFAGYRDRVPLVRPR